MICNNTKELLAEIKKYMDLNDIQMNELAVNIKKSQQSVSQIFNNGHPKCDTIFEVLNALNIKLDVNFIKINQDDTQ